MTNNGLFRPFAMVKGRAVATWALTKGQVTLAPFAAIPARRRRRWRPTPPRCWRSSASGRAGLLVVLVHMIEEYARHNGHADLIRESIGARPASKAKSLKSSLGEPMTSRSSQSEGDLDDVDGPCRLVSRSLRRTGPTVVGWPGLVNRRCATRRAAGGGGDRPAGPIGGTTVLANAPYASSVYPYQPTRVPAGIGVQSGNRLALITFAVVAVYLFIALESKIVIFGVLPLGLSLRSKRQGEPLAPFAIGAAVLAILVAAVRLLGH